MKKVRDMATTIMKLVETQNKAGIVGEADVLEAKVILLDAEVELLREQLKSQSGK
jgi:hypothetical protein